MLVGVLYFGKFTHAKQSKEKRLNKVLSSCSLRLGAGYRVGLMTFPGKHLVVTETRCNYSDATQTGGVPVGAIMTVMTLLGRSLSGTKPLWVEAELFIIKMFEDLQQHKTS